MKSPFFLAAGLSSFLLAVSAAAQDQVKFPAPDTTGAAGAPAAAAPAAFTDEQLAEEFGWFYAKKVGIADLQFTPAEVQALARGFSAAVGGQPAPYDLEKVGPLMDQYMQRKEGALMAKLKDQNAAQSEAFFARLKDNPKVVQTPSGLRYEIVKPGDGAYPKPSDTVKVNYTGTLIDGTVFDTSLKPRQAGGTAEPAVFQLSDVIPGWTEGIQKINKGGTIKLYIPANLAYGDEGRTGIPPGSTLIFTIDLLDITPGAAAAPAAAPAQ